MFFPDQGYCVQVSFYDSLGVKCPSCQVYVPLNLNVKVKCLGKDISYTYNIFHGLNDLFKILYSIQEHVFMEGLQLFEVKPYSLAKVSTLRFHSTFKFQEST